MNHFALRALKPLLVVLFVGSLMVQLVIIPLVAWDIIHEAFNTAAGIVYGACGILVVVCVQVAMFAMWRLLTLVQGDAIFAPDSLRWVDLIIRAGWVATALCLVVALYELAEWQNIGPFTVPIALFGSVVAALSVTLLVLVLRQLLAIAVDYKAELEEVV